VKALMVRFLGRRAVSGAISGMFVVLIFVAAVSALLAYNTSLDKYNQAVSEKNRMEWERLNEEIIIPSAERLDDGTLNATIRNIGAVTVHLVSLWLSAYDSNSKPQWQQQYSIDIWISPGETKYKFGQKNYVYTLIEPGSISKTLSSIYLPNTEWNYIIKVVTERGNIATYIIQPPIQEEIVPGYGAVELGYLTVEWTYFKYKCIKTVDHDNVIVVGDAFNITDVSKKDYFTFYVKLVNHGPADAYLKKYCVLALFGADLTGTSHFYASYIVDGVTYNPSKPGESSLDKFTSIVIPCNPSNPDLGGDSVEVIFGASNAGGNGGGPSAFGVMDIADGLYMAFLVLHYELGGIYYTQVIPFQAVTSTG
jgi:hypothetical protein